MAQTLASFKLVAACALLSTCAIALAGAPTQSALPVLPATPSAANSVKIVSIQGVVLGESYATDFRSEHPQVIAGWLLVIQADKAILAPRALAEPLVLASGAPDATGSSWIESVEWFNHGFASGHRVCFIPSPVNDKGLITHDVSGLRVWFGTPRLPESVDAATLEQERVLAEAANIQSTPLPKAAATVRLANREALMVAARALIARFAADEVQSDGVATAPVDPPAPAVK
ncbi:MAG: hypothetical protein EXS17_06245 [Phycisphaerales bacterium]|nr:hypothetical protein [Phycisphaerales bacterium]